MPLAGQISLSIAEDLLPVAVFFAKNAATIFLHVKAKLASFSLPLAKALAEIAINKLHAGQCRKFFADGL